MFGLSGCQSYERKPNCHLDKMHIKGNVVKVETIMQSTVPYTEMLAMVFDPQYAIFSYAGNTLITFNKDGNIRRYKGYGLDGKELFDVKKFKIENEDMNTIPVIFIGPNVDQNVGRVKTISSANGDVVNVKYFDQDELIWESSTYYNDDGSPKSIVKEYVQLSNESMLNISYADTTDYKYLEYDNRGNWTELAISYKGMVCSHAHSYKLKRRLTYLGDKEKPALIEDLDKYNDTAQVNTQDVKIVTIGEYGVMRIPHYMTMQSKDYISGVKDLMSPKLKNKSCYLLLSVYDDNDAYASLSIQYFSGDGSTGFEDFPQKYNKTIDKFFEEQMTAALATQGVYILKWLPYQFVTISGRRALKYTYYRFGNPIPVYCETYSIPMSDGNTLGINFSFQSNQYNRFYNDFKQSINSIRFR